MATMTLNINDCTTVYEICLNYISCNPNPGGLIASSSGYSKLSAGMLELCDEHILGDYVIEWRLDSVDGEILFLSANDWNVDTNIKRIHDPNITPQGFENEIVPGGEIFAVIKFIYVNGIRYDGYYSPGVNYSPDLLTCLGSTTVVDMTCTNGNQNGIYSHVLSYQYKNSGDADASNSFNFIYNNDGSSRYFAFHFKPEDVVDLLEVIAVKENPYQTETHLLSIIGGDFLNQQGITPGIITNGEYYEEGVTTIAVDFYRYKYIIDMTGIECDYIKLKITASILTNNKLTDWSIDAKCLEEWDCDQYIVNTGWTQLDVNNIDVSWNSSTCKYIVSIPSYEPLTISPEYDNYISIESPIKNAKSSIVDNYKIINTELKNGLDLIQKYTNNNDWSCRQADGVITYNRNKTLQRLRISFTNYNDFIHYYNNYQEVMSDSNIQGTSNNPDELEFYRRISLRDVVRDGCKADENMVISFYFHPSSFVTTGITSGNRYIDIFTHSNISDPSNTYLPHYPFSQTYTGDTSCTVENELDSEINNINNLYNKNDVTYTVTHGYNKPFFSVKNVIELVITDNFNLFCYKDFSKLAIDEICPNFNSSQYSINTTELTQNDDYGPTYRYYHHALNIELTKKDIYGDPDTIEGNSVGDYKIYQYGLYANGNINYNDKTLIKEVIGGITQ
jgi:hypothetical protein